MSVDRKLAAWLCACLSLAAPARADPPPKPKPAPPPRTAAGKPDAGVESTRAHPAPPPRKKPEDEAVLKNLELLMIMEMLKDYDLLDDAD